jgi:hypothetical protein
MPKAGIYLYESQSQAQETEFISVGTTQIELEAPVV